MVSYLGYLLAQSLDCPIVSTGYMYGITELNNKSLMRSGSWCEIRCLVSPISEALAYV